MSGGGTDFLTRLRMTNEMRQLEWTGDMKSGPMFAALELGGEVGELLNIVKKLEREAAGWVGSRATEEDLEDEIGDVLICLDLLAAAYGVDLATVTRRKFNDTSGKYGLETRLA